MIYQLLLSRDGCFQLVPDPHINLEMTMRTLAAASVAVGDTYQELAERAGIALQALENLQVSQSYRDPE